MKKLLGVLLGIVLVFLGAGNSFGYDFGTNITIYDGRGYIGSGVGGEDNETEPGMINSQAWDLEGFFLDDTTLTMVGGFDFINGVTGYSAYTSGDIFIDINGDAQYGDKADTSVPFAGYDYVIDLKFASPAKQIAGSYNVYKITDDFVLANVLEEYNSPESNPWKLESASNSSISTGNIGYLGFGEIDGIRDINAASVDIGFLGGKDFTAHFTQGCGNDNLMGKTAPVPEPATMMLFGCGLVGMALVGRKKFISPSA